MVLTVAAILVVVVVAAPIDSSVDPGPDGGSLTVSCGPLWSNFDLPPDAIPQFYVADDHRPGALADSSELVEPAADSCRSLGRARLGVLALFAVAGVAAIVVALGRRPSADEGTRDTP